MTCPNCGAEVVDRDAAFCARCGAPLAREDPEATEQIPLDATQGRPTGEPGGDGADAPGAAARVEDYASAVRGRFRSLWLDPIAAACLSFLLLLALGAVLLVAAKLQVPGFGAGANPIDVLTAVTVIALAILRVPVHIDTLVVSVLPLGALFAAGAGIAWATSIALRDRTDNRLVSGALVGIPFATICWLSSLVFRFGGANEVYAGAWGALFWGLVWGCVFGMLGAVRVPAGRRHVLARLEDASRGGVVRRGIGAAAVALAAIAVLGCIALLLSVIVGLIRGAPRPGFSVGDAVAAFVYLLAFAPNVVVTLTALGMGAPVYVGARVTVGGSAVGRLRRVWLFDDAPGIAPLLLLIPAVACSLAGFWARRVSSRGEHIPVIGTFAVVFAAVLALLAWLGEARLGAALLGRGFARLDVNAPATFLLGLVWGVAGGAIGWIVADRSSPGGAA